MASISKLAFVLGLSGIDYCIANLNMQNAFFCGGVLSFYCVLQALIQEEGVTFPEVLKQTGKGKRSYSIDIFISREISLYLTMC